MPAQRWFIERTARNLAAANARRGPLGPGCREGAVIRLPATPTPLRTLDAYRDPLPAPTRMSTPPDGLFHRRDSLSPAPMPVQDHPPPWSS